MNDTKSLFAEVTKLFVHPLAATGPWVSRVASFITSSFSCSLGTTLLTIPIIYVNIQLRDDELYLNTPF